MKTKTRPRRSKTKFAALAAMTLVAVCASAPRRALAQSCFSILPRPGNLNICEVLLEDLTLPVTNCVDPGFWECALPFSPAAGCCVPSACAIFPHCQIVTAASYVAHAGDLHCNFDNYTGEKLLEKFAERNVIKPTADVLNGLFNVMDAHVTQLECAGRPLPAAVKSLVRNLIADMDTVPFHDIDLDAVVLVSSNEPTSNWYLDWGGTSRAAITLDDVVLMQAEYFDLLMSVQTTRDALERAARSDRYAFAINLLIHELVHVRQYREMGDRTFVLRYLIDALTGDDDKVATEYEAYSLSSENASSVGGYYCWAVTPFYEERAAIMDDPSLVTDCIDPMIAIDVLRAIKEAEVKRIREEVNPANFLAISHGLP